MLGRQTDGNQKKKKRSTGKNAVLGNTKMAYIYILPVFIFLGVFTYYAMAFNIGISFDSWNGVSPEKIFVGLDNYMKLMKDPYFHLALKNTTVYFLLRFRFRQSLDSCWQTALSIRRCGRKG